MWMTLWPAGDLPAGQVRIVEADQTDILVYRTSAGRIGAIEAWCPHMRNYMPNGLAPERPLSDLLDGEEIQCPFHGWRFDSLGRCTGVPAAQKAPRAVAEGRPIMHSWEVREQNGLLQLRKAGSKPGGCDAP